jgi:hypothetical protein
MQKKSLIAGIIIGIILGYALGQLIWLSPREEASTRFSALKKLLGSGTVDSASVTLAGTIADISGQNLTLEKNGKQFSLTIGAETKVFKASVVSAESGENQNPVPEEIGLKDLKANDAISAALSVSSEGKLETMSIFVVPEVD